MPKELLWINESYTQRSHHLIASQHYGYFPCSEHSHPLAYSIIARCKEVW